MFLLIRLFQTRFYFYFVHSCVTWARSASLSCRIFTLFSLFLHSIAAYSPVSCSSLSSCSRSSPKNGPMQSMGFPKLGNMPCPFNCCPFLYFCPLNCVPFFVPQPVVGQKCPHARPLCRGRFLRGHAAGVRVSVWLLPVPVTDISGFIPLNK